MRKLLIASLCLFVVSNNAFAKTEWYTETMPNGLSTLTGVFNKNGIGLMFGCTENFFSAGVIVLNVNKKGSQPGPTQINVTTLDNESANFIAEPIPSADNNYTFMSSNAMASISTFHMLDTANKKPFQIELINDKLSLSNKWLVDTKDSGEAIRTFKQSCQLINN